MSGDAPPPQPANAVELGADFGPPGAWVARHGLPVGGALLDAGGPADDVGRYAFLGLAPVEVLRVESPDPDAAYADAFEALDALWARARRPAPGSSPGPEALPCPRVICALAYDLGRLVEPLPSLARNDGPLPALWAARYGALYVWDRALGRGAIVADSADEAWALHGRLAAGGPPPGPFQVGAVRCETCETDYRAAFERVRAHIQAGDTYQINLTARFCAPRSPGGDPATFYGRLFARSPAPFACLLRLDADVAVAGISPERFLRFWPDGRVETRPIKGTRPRGATPALDAAAVEALLASEKDAAEHVMIVDLERNDLGRVCVPGSVAVSSSRAVETHPTVHHLVSTVVGRLRGEVTLPALLRATFPGGSITGAPKIRAMEIVDAVEPVRRGLYCGAVGHLDADGGGDLNIAIRTAYTGREAVWYHAGGGLVADSEPEAEWAELHTKARAFVRACEDSGPI